MRNIRLKPIYLPNDDILIQPPNFLSQPDPVQKPSTSKIYLTNLEDLKTILRGRKLKSLTARKKLQVDDQESVVRLSDFKPQPISKSPLTRKYTFRRTSTLNNSALLSQSPVKQIENANFMQALQSISSKEKGKNKDMESELQKFTENNKDFEVSLMNKMKKVNRDIEETSESITRIKSNIKSAQNEKEAICKKYEDDMNSLLGRETNLTLSMHSVKGKKKHPDVSEEREYFILKEALRKSKRELHAHHVEVLEKITLELDSMGSILDRSQKYKKDCQKELKDLLDMLINFYCMNLKEGMDLREDGIRWVIKALWKMKQAVPVSAFPKYLDDESSHFLLFVSEKELEISYMQKKLEELREVIKKDGNSKRFMKSPKELYDVVQGRLRDIKKKSRAVSMNNSEIMSLITEDEAENYGYHYEEIRTLKEKLKSDKEIIEKMFLDEVKRVVGIYNPENFKDIELSHVIKCLVGDKFKEFRRLARDKTRRETIIINTKN